MDDPHVAREQVERNEAKPEDGSRDEREACDHRGPVEHRFLPDGRDDADRDRDSEPDDHRADDQHERRGQAVKDDVPDLLVVLEYRFSKVEWTGHLRVLDVDRREDSLHVAGELGQLGIVQSEALADDVDLLG